MRIAPYSSGGDALVKNNVAKTSNAAVFLTQVEMPKHLILEKTALQALWVFFAPVWET